MAHETFTLGVEIVTLGVSPAYSRVRAWRNGAAVTEADHVSYTQSAKPYVAIVALATGEYFWVGRIEVRDYRGGNLVWAQNLDYPNWATMQASGWNYFGAPPVFANGKMGLQGGAFSHGVYAEMSGASPKYFELQNCHFGVHTSQHWGMLAPYWNGGAYGEGSFRVLHREIGTSVEIVDGFNASEPVTPATVSTPSLRLRQRTTPLVVN